MRDEIEIPKDIRLKMYNFKYNYNIASYSEYLVRCTCDIYLKICNKDIMLKLMRDNKNIKEFIDIVSN